MQRFTIAGALVALGAMAFTPVASAKPAASATAAPQAQTAPDKQARGNPQRGDQPPPGLLRVIERQVPGIENAINRTTGSNSRLQDLPTSP